LRRYITFSFKIGRYAVPDGESAVDMGKKVGTGMRGAAFLDSLRRDRMDVTRWGCTSCILLIFMPALSGFYLG
jgi:hypothetical protein